ncbi:MAG TPA: NCS2 family permease, partial [Microlunatus sp.]|nr:NCS2 family permease [Microlunatus sp.]
NEATLVGLGSLSNPNAWLAIIGLLGTAVLMYKKIKGAILYGIIGTSLLAIITRAPVYVGPDGNPAAFSGFANGVVGVPVWPTDLIGQLDIGAALGLGLFSVVFTFFFVDFFDATGTLTGLAQRAGYLDAKGDMPRARLTFSMDGLAAMFGAFVGTSTTTAYVESASGIEEGGKTGVTASTVGVLFILSTFLWPLAGAVPGAATAPALILVGALMMQAAKDIDWTDLSEGVPAFLTVILMPLTFSIANGVSFGVIAYCVIKLVSGEGRKVSPILYVVALLLIARYVFLAEA